MILIFVSFLIASTICQPTTPLLYMEFRRESNEELISYAVLIVLPDSNLVQERMVQRCWSSYL